jgi:uncharacterized protein YbjT (DUF2867 family)
LRILLTGATGLIGSSVLAALCEEQHEVVAVVRQLDAAACRLPARDFVILDFRRASAAEDWLPHLRNIDAVVNCAGVLQDSPRDSPDDVHFRGIAALFDACVRARVRRVIHLSAIGVDLEAPTAFSCSKLRGDEDLMGRDLDWIILRPSVVVGRPAYGGSALFRGLAALPIFPVASDTGPLQIVQLDDVIRTILFFLRPEAPARKTLELAGPRRLSMTDVVRSYRRWLGKPAARIVPLPRWIARAMFRGGDFIGWLGWRPPIRSTARREILRGAIGNPAEWMRITGIKPKDLDHAFAANPATVQERWFAQLYLLKALAFFVFSVFWIVTGIIALTVGWENGKALMFQIGVSAPLAAPTVLASALADIAIGIAIAVRKTTRRGLFAALVISIIYLIVGAILVPGLWSDPLGPMLKIGPIIALNLILIAILDER